MKSKRFVWALFTLLAVVAIGTAALATEGGGAEPPAPPAEPETTREWGHVFRYFPELTEEQLEEMKEHVIERIERFDVPDILGGLTEEQQAELDALMGQMAGLQTQIIDKYAEWGLIDEETAERMKGFGGMITMPPDMMPGFRGGFSFSFGKGGCPEIPAPDTMTDTQKQT